MGIILPVEMVKERKLKENDRIRILIQPKEPMMEFFGMLGPLTEKERKRMTASFMRDRKRNRELEWEDMEKLTSLTRGRR